MFMKQKITFLLFLISGITLAQIPAGYYNTATGSGAVLKTQLYNIIKGHTNNGYDGLYTTYQTSDIDSFYENDGTIMDMYSERPTAADPYNYGSGPSQRCGNYSSEGDCYNREHIIPQSTFSSANPMVADAHFITPTDGKVNGMRSNYPHGNVATASWTSLNGGKLGSSAVSGYTGTVFEPINEFKGDIARMYFYFVTRYENTVSGYSYAAFSGNTFPALDSAFLSMLMTWHNNDPVSAFEITRNNAIYARQGNRNPYIDHPEYVAMVWGGGSCPADSVAPSVPTTLTSTGNSSSTISLTWGASTDNTAVTNYDVYVNGVKWASSGGTTSITLSGLDPSTTYSIYVVAKDCQNNVSSPSNTINVNTAAPGTCSSNVNETFETIPANSSAYTTNSWTTGGITWTATDSRTDQTITSRAITVRNGTLSATAFAEGIGSLTVKTQLKFAGSSGSFNLKVNGTTVGTIPYSSTATSTTISNINIPGNVIISFEDNSTTTNRVAFDDLTWICFATLSTENFTENTFSIYPNPSNGNFRIEYDPAIGNINVEIFSAIGQKVFEKQNINDTNISTNNLQKGIYLLKITNDSKSIVKKIVIN
ncbi:Por secretion system C-terminal sorting domain-containing protein [Flavobacterium terrae]|uniref:Por secretion system C-terminal sorting domain-containing protein n=2 Tax=Flavobacterium terrae TaxID=415425 RepID=A0A1M6GXR8_9FLAO|nr:Por secretion system C-terminal sorting domain-containing protein [Flavobacterium terrae]